MTKKRYLFVLVILVMVYCTGCTIRSITNDPIINSSQLSYVKEPSATSINFKRKIIDTSNRDIIPGTEKLKGIRYRIYNTDGLLDNRYNYILKTNETWDKFISISNMIDKSSTYKLFLLVDYKPHNFKIDDVLVDSFTFKLNSNETIEIPTTIDKLPEGLHDVLFLIVRDSDIKSTDHKFRSATLTKNLLYIRFSIITNNDIAPSYNLSNFTQEATNDKFDGIILNKNLNTTDLWFTDELESSNSLSYYSHIINSSFNTSQKYALITFVDWKPVETENKHVHFIKVDQGKKVTIPLNINLPKTKETHDITSIIVSNPFEKLDKYNNNVFISARIGITTNNK